MTGFVAQSFKKNQESLYYLKLSDFRFLVVIIVFNNNKKYWSQRRSLLLIKSAHVPIALQLWVI